MQGEIPTPALTLEIARALNVEPDQLLKLAKSSRILSATRAVERVYAQFIADHGSAIKTASESKQSGKVVPGMTKVVSFINMKGGVGKTTMAMHLARSAASQGFRTLAVDLDPQSNLSQALMGAERYVKHLTQDMATVVRIFDEYVSADRSGSSRQYDVTEAVTKIMSHAPNRVLNLIPSRLELSRTLKNPAGKERRLAKALSRIHGDYDLIVVDCAPTESVLTDAAYFASSYVIVPIKPEFMATIGLPLLAKSLDDFKLENEDKDIDIAGIVFNHSSNYIAGPEAQNSIKDVTTEAKKHGWHIFENQIRYSASYPKSAREGTSLAATSYARHDVSNSFQLFAAEVFRQIGLRKVRE